MGFGRGNKPGLSPAARAPVRLRGAKAGGRRKGYTAAARRNPTPAGAQCALRGSRASDEGLGLDRWLLEPPREHVQIGLERRPLEPF
jgi:hypothetical protein